MDVDLRPSDPQTNTVLTCEDLVVFISALPVQYTAVLLQRLKN